MCAETVPVDVVVSVPDTEERVSKLGGRHANGKSERYPVTTWSSQRPYRPFVIGSLTAAAFLLRYTGQSVNSNPVGGALLIASGIFLLPGYGAFAVTIALALRTVRGRPRGLLDLPGHPA